MKPSPWLVLFSVAALAGLVFAGFSTFDFVQHLDRQVHAINCSFIPGLATPDASGTSGCHTTLMSPYSSVFRKAMWGGLPVSLPGMAVFAFLLFRGVDLAVARSTGDVAARRFLVFASVVPFLTSVVMGYLAIAELDAVCKLCIGIYVSSAVCLLASVLALRESRSHASWGEESEQEPLGEPAREYLLASAQFGVFVAIPALLYVVAAPSHDGFIGACGGLQKPEDTYGVMVDLDPGSTALEAIEVFDPLCPACKGMDRRLESSGLGAKIHRKAVLFPLDASCNWMVGSTLHPGACIVSEAVLCAGARAPEVSRWAFDHQQEIMDAARADAEAPKALVKQAFPDLAGCVGSAKAKAMINRSLRWAVANKLQVLTPQLFLGGRKLCDEDTDLGMDYALARLVDPTWAPPAPTPTAVEVAP